MKVPVEGLEELVDETKKYLSDAIKNKKNHFLSIQKVKIQERKQAMIEECKTIIHVASGAAGAAGLIPIPFSDMPLIAGIQTGMIYEMNDAFGMDLDKSVGASLVAGLLGVTTVAQVGRTLVNGLLKFIPVVGSVVGGATAAVITEALGFVYLKVLEYYYNDEMGEVDLPGEVGMITSLFKENYLNLDTIKKLTQ
ncbi:YcjF family protein [Helicobacter pylori]|uniref:YcjF family protein n=1 Tax=Helicobacter pylori TaxID=210 RepID=UPI001F619816|nr:YcjF family protein [Helicobacter pylori]